MCTGACEPRIGELARQEKNKAKPYPQGTCQEGTPQGRVWTLLPEKMQVPVPYTPDWVIPSKPLHLF